ncbi:hypothetical protein AB0F46_38785 [Streptomyces sp. NPDC026665]|uniref:hypothetical protein n=1 Tax=Streptomyces sp. NPDC026665 TaxID=3154798 RepID=UPI003406A83E
MATDINIPGDELREAQNMLGFVHDLIDIDRHTFDFDAAFGRDLSRGAARHFEKKWDDGKKQLKRQVKGVREAIGSILDSFEQTDRDAVANLDDGKSSQ